MVLSALFPICVLIVVAKLGSSPNAAANSLSVSNVAGAESTMFATCVSTYVVVAIPSVVSTLRTRASV